MQEDMQQQPHIPTSPPQDALPQAPSLRAGLTNLGNDGMLRSFSSTGMVVDYVRLNNEEVMNSILLLPDDMHEPLREMFEGVDGYSVPKERLSCGVISNWLKSRHTYI